MDRLTTQQRHANMAAIRSKDTKPEMTVRRGLWKRGFRYRLNDKRLPGHPEWQQNRPSLLRRGGRLFAGWAGRQLLTEPPTMSSSSLVMAC